MCIVIAAAACPQTADECRPTFYLETFRDGGVVLPRTTTDVIAPYTVCANGEVRRVRPESSPMEYPEQSACRADEDCGAGQACVVPVVDEGDESTGISRVAPRCVPAQCLSGEDCPGGICRAGFDGCGVVERFACAQSEDRCSGRDSCLFGMRCTVRDGVFQCLSGTCVSE